MTDIDREAEAPLDPATERVRRKMVRLLAVSIGIMFVGLMAVLAAVVYRMGEGGGPAAGSTVALQLPEGAEVLDMSLDADRVAFRIAGVDGGAGEVVILSLATGEILSRHPLSRR